MSDDGSIQNRDLKIMKKERWSTYMLLFCAIYCFGMAAFNYVQAPELIRMAFSSVDDVLRYSVIFFYAPVVVGIMALIALVVRRCLENYVLSVALTWAALVGVVAIIFWYWLGEPGFASVMVTPIMIVYVIVLDWKRARISRNSGGGSQTDAR